MIPIEMIMEIAEILYGKNLFYYKEGNISIKEENSIYITKSGTIKGILTEKDVVKWEMNNLPPKDISSEWRMHKAIYDKTDASLVIHLHSVYLSVLSANTHLMKPVIQEDAIYLERMGIIEDIPFGTEKLANAVKNKINEETDCLILKNHGIIAWGKNYKDVTLKLYGMEIMAKRIIFNSILKKG